MAQAATNRAPSGAADTAVDAQQQRQYDAFTGTVAEHLVLAVAPSTGKFQPVAVDGKVALGTVLGHVTGGNERADEVRAPVHAWVRGLLARPGQSVMRGQPLAWLDRLGAGR